MSRPGKSVLQCARLRGSQWTSGPQGWEEDCEWPQGERGLVAFFDLLDLAITLATEATAEPCRCLDWGRSKGMVACQFLTTELTHPGPRDQGNQVGNLLGPDKGMIDNLALQLGTCPPCRPHPPQN